MNELSSTVELKSKIENLSPEKGFYSDSERPAENSFQPYNAEMSKFQGSYNDSDRSESGCYQPRGLDNSEFKGELNNSEQMKEIPLSETPSESSIFTANSSNIPEQCIENKTIDFTSIQEKEISQVKCGEQLLDGTLEKGNFGEMVTDVELKNLGYERISVDTVTSLKDTTHKGIDGVYFNENGHPQYLIVDAKYGFAQLSDTLDGKQMSDNWIDKRLDEAVGKERADDIRMAQLFDPDNVEKFIAHVNEDGQINFDKLDNNGDVIERNVKINGQG